MISKLKRSTKQNYTLKAIQHPLTNELTLQKTGKEFLNLRRDVEDISNVLLFSSYLYKGNWHIWYQSL